MSQIFKFIRDLALVFLSFLAEQPEIWSKPVSVFFWLKWIGMNEIWQNIPESGICVCDWIGTDLNNVTQCTPAVGETLRFSTRPWDRVQNGEIPRYKSWDNLPKLVPVLSKLANLKRQFSQMMARRRHCWAHWQHLRDLTGAQPARSWNEGIDRVASDFYGRACLPRKQQRAHEYKRSEVESCHEARGDDLKVRPTECSGA